MSSFKLKNGVNHCTNNQYHGDKSYFSSSNLKIILKDVEKFKKECIDGEVERVQKNVFDEGNYAHSLILEPDTISKEYSFFTGFRKSGKDWESFKDSNKDKIILSKPQKHRVEKWVDSYNNRPEAVNLISGGMAELSVAGELRGVPVKVRADYINVDRGYVADVKTTAYNTDVDSFRYVVQDLNYDLSASLYCQMFEQHYGKPFDFYFIVLGKRDIDCQVYKASEETMTNGNILVNQALTIYKDRLKLNDWTNSDKKVIIESDNYEILEV